MARSMGKTLCIITLVTLCAFIGADARRCYVCQDCSTVTDEHIQTCEVTTTAAPGTTITSSGTTESTGETTLAPGGEATTLAPGGEVTTLAPGGEATTLAPGGEATTLAPGGEATTLAPGGEATTLAPGGEATTLAPGGEATTLAPGGEATTLAPGGGVTTLAPGGAATTPAPGGEATTLAPGGAATTLAPGGEATTLAPGGAATTLATGGEATTLATGGEATTLAPGGVSPPGALPDGGDNNAALLGDSNKAFWYRGKRSVMHIRTEPEPQCLVAIITDNGTENTIRQCYFPPAQAPADPNERCRDAVGGPATITSCNVCDEDLCNASARTTGTIALIIASLFTALRFYAV